MNSILVSRNPYSIILSRNGVFLTSIPIRRRIKQIDSNGKRTWTALNLKPGETADLIRRLTRAVNSHQTGSLLQKINEEMNTPYTPTETVAKSFETRMKNRKNRRKQGRGTCFAAQTQSAQGQPRERHSSRRARRVRRSFCRVLKPCQRLTRLGLRQFGAGVKM
jgi:hypothetical protein